MKSKSKLVVLIIALGLLLSSGAFAQGTLPTPNAGFDILGFIQGATVKAGAAPNRGGTITVNNRLITVPDNMIVQMPAASFTWAQLFDPAFSTPVGNYVPARPVQPANNIGLALNSPLANHYPSYEVRVVGNIITAGNTQTYIAALILPVSQQGLNSASGYINYIDYDGLTLGMPGRFRVGGTIGVSTSGILCELNDPVGRFGAAHSPDPRFSADTNNPTITTATGYPVGIPTVAPTAIPLPAGEIGDPDRPYINRPANGGAFGTDPFLANGAPLKAFTMPIPGSPGSGVTDPTPFKQIPLMMGDWVDVSGTLLKLNPANAAVGPTNSFLSVHTMTAHLGIKTAPGTDPAYVRVEEFLFGVGEVGNAGPTVAGIAQETSTRVVLVAFCTDDQGNAAGTKNPYPISIFGIYNPPPAGPEQEIAFPNGSGPANPEVQMDDPVRGRIRLQMNKNEFPAGSKIFFSNAAGPGNFYREYIVKLNGNRQLLLAPEASTVPGTPGLIAGQYRLPIFDYIFGEGTQFGQPWPPFNFHQFGFLFNGEGALGPLTPFPTFQ